jgi:hypothetical protein
MKPTHGEIRTSFWFAIALSAIAIVANLAGYRMTGNDSIGVMPFMCFLPICFMFASEAQRKTRDYIETLEERVRQLEGKSAHS